MTKAILVEYKALRDEAMVLYNRRATIQNLGTALFSGLQAVAFIHNVPELSIGATLLILAFYQDDVKWVEAGAMIGAYIRNIIEPRVPGLQWETILDSSIDPQRKTPTLRRRLAKLLSRYPMTAIVGCGLSVTALLTSGIASTLRICIDVLLICITVLWGVHAFVVGTNWGAMHQRWNEEFRRTEIGPDTPDAHDGSGWDDEPLSGEES